MADNTYVEIVYVHCILYKYATAGIQTIAQQTNQHRVVCIWIDQNVQLEPMSCTSSIVWNQIDIFIYIELYIWNGLFLLAFIPFVVFSKLLFAIVGWEQYITHRMNKNMSIRSYLVICSVHGSFILFSFGLLSNTFFSVEIIILLWPAYGQIPCTQMLAYDAVQCNASQNKRKHFPSL